jgi:hypothetical protein
VNGPVGQPLLELGRRKWGSRALASSLVSDCSPSSGARR